METKQSMEMQVVSLVFLEIARQLGSDSCLLMTTIEIPGFYNRRYGRMVSKSTQKDGKMLSENRIDFLSLFSAFSCTVLIHATLVSRRPWKLSIDTGIRKDYRALKKLTRLLA